MLLLLATVHFFQFSLLLLLLLLVVYVVVVIERVVDEFLLGAPIVSFFACLCECIFAEFLSRANRGSRKGREHSMDKQRLECTSRVYFFKDIIF
jgi:hypothetical protein